MTDLLAPGVAATGANGTGPPPSPDPQVIEQPRRSVDSWDNAPADLGTEDLFVPAVKDFVTCRGLSVGMLSQIYQRCTTNKPGAKVPVDVVRINTLKFKEGVVEPKFTEQQANDIQFKFGPAFVMVIEKIDELTNEDPNAAEALARFRAGTRTG